ncbi:hypothetical protein ABOC32_24300 [Pseudomonas sp. WOUb67]|uniref:DUF6916 family protein n=1 Tax=Pseudomonas sp. WOUb67 TaxID=3161136 RepID=UPI003CED2B47
MSDLDFRIPTREDLASGAAGGGFTLQIAPDEHLPVELVDLRDGSALNTDYDCYLATFVLPHGVSLPQAVFRLTGPDAREWLLLLTPVLPEPDGRHALELVIHTRRESIAAH